MSIELEALKAALNNDPPPAIRTLPPQVQQALADDILAAQRRQQSQLAESFEQTIAAIPFPMRSIARKVLLG